HPPAREPDLPADPALRERHGDGERRRDRARDAVSLGAHEDNRRADRRARRRGPVRSRPAGRRQEGRRDPLGWQRRLQVGREILLTFQIFQRSFPAKIGIESSTALSSICPKRSESSSSSSPDFSPKGGPRSPSSKKKNPATRPRGPSSFATRSAWRGRSGRGSEHRNALS